MNRRDFNRFIGVTAAALPFSTHAQQLARPAVGFLHSGSQVHSPHVRGFGAGLAELGYVDGQNITIKYRFAEGRYEKLAAMVSDLVRENVTVIAAAGGVHTAIAARSASTGTPVIFANGSDPVHFGLVESLNRPGGNMTGVSFFNATLEAKRLGLLFELVPAARSFGVLINQANDNAEMQLKDIAQGGLMLGRPISIQKASNEPEIDAAFETFSQQRISALLVASDPYFFGERRKLVTEAARLNLPALYEWREFAEAGGLASYGTSLFDNYRMTGTYVGRVLKGEKPANLPVLQATKFEFVINLKTARALGLDILPTLSARSDDVIE